MTALESIDIVVTWVDDSDLDWRTQRDALLGDRRVTREGADDARFRDWGALKYWFRAVEENCSWVRKIHLITVNPVPSWLRVDHPKLAVVHHDEFIPGQYLPTFNSRAIELHLHKVPGLSERFVYFNDDAYPMRPLPESHFFPKGRPAGMAIQNALSVGDSITHAMLNNIRIINEHFSKRRVMRKSWWKWFAPKYGRGLLQNIALSPWSRFTGFHNHHLPLPLLRETMRDVWESEPEALALTSESRFRQFHDVNPFLFGYWQMCTGDFTPVSRKHYGEYVQLGAVSEQVVVDKIRAKTAAILCVNDGKVDDYDSVALQLEAAFQTAFPMPSSFERD